MSLMFACRGFQFLGRALVSIIVVLFIPFVMGRRVTC